MSTISKRGKLIGLLRRSQYQQYRDCLLTNGINRTQLMVIYDLKISQVFTKVIRSNTSKVLQGNNQIEAQVESVTRWLL